MRSWPCQWWRLEWVLSNLTKPATCEAIYKKSAVALSRCAESPISRRYKLPLTGWVELRGLPFVTSRFRYRSQVGSSDDSNYQRNKDEFDLDGVKVIRGKDLSHAKCNMRLASKAAQVTIYTPAGALRKLSSAQDSHPSNSYSRMNCRALLNTACVLRDANCRSIGISIDLLMTRNDVLSLRSQCNTRLQANPL